MRKHERRQYTSTYDYLRHGTLPRVGAALLVTALAAGCGSAARSGAPSAAGKSGGGGAAATGPETAGQSPSPAAASSSPAAETGSGYVAAAPRSGWCGAASAVIEKAFAAPASTATCDVLPASSTPGDPLVRFTLSAAGVNGFMVELSVLNISYDTFTQGFKSTPTSAGGEYIMQPGTDKMYATVPGEAGETAVVEVLTGQGGASPEGAQASLAASVAALGIFGNVSNATLYP